MPIILFGGTLEPSVLNLVIGTEGVMLRQGLTGTLDMVLRTTGDLQDNITRFTSNLDLSIESKGVLHNQGALLGSINLAISSKGIIEPSLTSSGILNLALKSTGKIDVAQAFTSSLSLRVVSRSVFITGEVYSGTLGLALKSRGAIGEPSSFNGSLNLNLNLDSRLNISGTCELPNSNGRWT